MSRFFIDRPVFAWVLAIVLMLVGAVSITETPDRPIPADRAASRFHQRHLPWRVC